MKEVWAFNLYSSPAITENYSMMSNAGAAYFYPVIAG
jgi:hypothetical protein